MHKKKQLLRILQQLLCEMPTLLKVTMVPRIPVSAFAIDSIFAVSWFAETVAVAIFMVVSTVIMTIVGVPSVFGAAVQCADRAV